MQSVVASESPQRVTRPQLGENSPWLRLSEWIGPGPEVPGMFIISVRSTEPEFLASVPNNFGAPKAWRKA